MTSITAGERAKNWGSAFMTIWPAIVLLLGGAVYSGDKIKSLITDEPPPTPKEIQPIEDGYYDQTLRDIIAEIDGLKRADAGIAAALAAQDTSNKAALIKRLDAQWIEIEKVRKLVQ